MKLIFCPKCQDVIKLRKDYRTCYCGASGGNYKSKYKSDNLYAVISGDAIPIGFINDSFVMSLLYPGTNFTAFVIKEPCKTISKV